jgi:hypothetical protein
VVLRQHVGLASAHLLTGLARSARGVLIGVVAVAALAGGAAALFASGRGEPRASSADLASIRISWDDTSSPDGSRGSTNKHTEMWIEADSGGQVRRIYSETRNAEGIVQRSVFPVRSGLIGIISPADTCAVDDPPAGDRSLNGIVADSIGPQPLVEGFGYTRASAGSWVSDQGPIKVYLTQTRGLSSRVVTMRLQPGQRIVDRLFNIGYTPEKLPSSRFSTWVSVCKDAPMGGFSPGQTPMGSSAPLGAGG